MHPVIFESGCNNGCNKKTRRISLEKRTTREQWINWFYWLIGISIVLFAWKIISDKTVWFFVQDAPGKPQILALGWYRPNGLIHLN